jgi:prepilin-type processing-associated H-X9-DG protein
MGNLLLAPNPKYPNCCSNAASTLAVPGMWTLSSFHPGGCNVLMCDGSVKFLKDSTNLQTIWALGSRAQGEVLSADAYWESPARRRRGVAPIKPVGSAPRNRGCFAQGRPAPVPASARLHRS